MTKTQELLQASPAARTSHPAFTSQITTSHAHQGQADLPRLVPTLEELVRIGEAHSGGAASDHYASAHRLAVHLHRRHTLTDAGGPARADASTCSAPSIAFSFLPCIK